MKSEQVLSVAERTVATLLSLRWRRVSNTQSPRGFDNRQNQQFEFSKEDGTVVCNVEFEHREFDEGPMFGSIWGRSGKISDNNGLVVLEDTNLTDTYAKPSKHPLNDLHDMIWGKEYGEPVSLEGKFPETIKLEKFTEGLRA